MPTTLREKSQLRSNWCGSLLYDFTRANGFTGFFAEHERETVEKLALSNAIIYKRVDVIKFLVKKKIYKKKGSSPDHWRIIVSRVYEMIVELYYSSDKLRPKLMECLEVILANDDFEPWSPTITVLLKLSPPYEVYQCNKEVCELLLKYNRISKAISTSRFNEFLGIKAYPICKYICFNCKIFGDFKVINDKEQLRYIEWEFRNEIKVKRACGHKLDKYLLSRIQEYLS